MFKCISISFQDYEIKSNTYSAILTDDDGADESEEDVDEGPVSLKRQISTLAQAIQRTVWFSYTKTIKELQKDIFLCQSLLQAHHWLRVNK